MTELSNTDRRRIFDDWRSFIHSILGFVSVLLPKPIGFMIFLFFLFYELIEPDESASYDIIEFLIGYVLGSLLL